MCRRIASTLSIFLGVFLLVGCATSSEPVRVGYDARSNQTTYRTSKMRLGDIEMSSGLQSQDRFYIRVVGQCGGQNCVPSEYSLNFIKLGPESITLEGRDVSLTIGTETITWDDPQTREVSQTTTVRSGTFSRVNVSSGQLATIGSVSNVSGSVGGSRFSLPYETRAPIRSLISRLDQQSADSTDANS